MSALLGNPALLCLYAIVGFIAVVYWTDRGRMR